MLRREELWALIDNEQDAVRWAMRMGLIRRANVCPKCTQQMHLQATSRSVEGLFWRCSRNTCGKPRTSVRTGSLFMLSHETISKNIKFIYEWARGQSCESICFELGLSSPTIVSWTQACRDAIAHYYFSMRRDYKIGGPGKTVEIDETVVARRKFNVGRLVPTQWLFGGVTRDEIGGQLECFLELVDDRTKSTLHEILARRVHAGTYICSDSWKAYDGLSELGFGHGKVNHSQNFLNPFNPTIHTQAIESLWSKLKRFFRKKCFNRRIHLYDYILEFLFRNEFKDVFGALLVQFALLFEIK